MFRRKLIALDFHKATDFNIKDEQQLRNLVVWLEDQKIRHYKIEDRAGLRNIVGGDWQKHFSKYLEDLAFPGKIEDKGSTIDWLLGYAVRLEYGDNADKYKHVTGDMQQSGTTAGGAPGTPSNPLDKLDFNGADFKAGITSLATMLQIPPHLDHEMLTKAICLLIKDKLSKEAVEKAQKQGGKAKQQMPLDKLDLGFECGDYISNEAAKILRLLHVRELRDLQNQVNEAIVAVQGLTANPKTDTRLGKVGR